MDHFSTVLAKSIVRGKDIKEVFRQQLENALNSTMKYELNVFGRAYGSSSVHAIA